MGYICTHLKEYRILLLGIDILAGEEGQGFVCEGYFEEMCE